MAWIEPKTNWTPSDYCTADDMNRMTGNVAYLLTQGDPENTFADDDIVTLGEWEYIINNCIILAKVAGIDIVQPDNRTTYDNFNNVESIIALLKNPMERRYNMYKYNHYSGSIYCNAGIYSGGV